MKKWLPTIILKMQEIIRLNKIKIKIKKQDKDGLIIKVILRKINKNRANLILRTKMTHIPNP